MAPSSIATIDPGGTPTPTLGAPTASAVSTESPAGTAPVLPATSVGCGSSTADKAGDRTIMIEAAGVERTALVHVPRSELGSAKPLVLSFHGTTGNPADEATVDGLEAVADREHFVVAYPAGVGDPASWSYSTWTGVEDDVPFVTALLDTLGARLCLDPRRTYATGLSAGGAMTKVLACRLVDRLAAVMLVAAVYGPEYGDCLPARPVPTLVFHGVLDPLATWHGARIPIPLFDGWPATRDVLEWAGAWAANNGCSGDPVAGEPIGWATELQWQGCLAPMILWRLDDAGHTWPGGTGFEAFGKFNHDVSASELGWAFFAAASLGG